MFALIGIVVVSVYVGGVVVVGGKVLNDTGKLTTAEIKDAVTWPAKLF